MSSSTDFESGKESVILASRSEGSGSSGTAATPLKVSLSSSQRFLFGLSAKLQYLEPVFENGKRVVCNSKIV